MPLKLYNSITRQKEEFKALQPGRVSMYTCGPTVYDYAHIGNFRAYVFEDLLHRVLRFKGYEVVQIMNLTDVDDKTIRNARQAGQALDEYTHKYKQAFFEDIKTLNITPCTAYPAATEHIDAMVRIIRGLEEKGFAYRKNGSLYFSIEKFTAYGKLAHLDADQLQDGASGRVDVDEYDKDNVRDFVLWKGYSEDDGDVYWESELGKGRPGWHIECSAMSMEYLGETMDIHTGGVDNLFPHHENEIAQSEAYTGKPFVRYWLHCDYLIVDNKKMSKSAGNFYTLRDILKKGAAPEAVRYLLLTTHYRKMLNFSLKGLQAAASALEKLNAFIQEILEYSEAGANSSQTQTEKCEALQQTMLADFEKALADDLNISEALAAVFVYVRAVRELGELSREEAEKVLEAMRRVDTVLGVLSFVPQKLSEEEAALIREREELRRQRDFRKADTIRDQLAERGIFLKDTPQGTDWVKK